MVRHNRKRFASLTGVLLLVGWGVLWLRSQPRQHTLNRQLIAALMHNDTHETLKLIDAGADPNTRYLSPPPPSIEQLWRELLPHSVPSGNDNPTAFLIACGLSWQNDRWSIWPSGSRSNDARPVQAMLEHGANVNVHDETGWTPLECAVLADRSTAVSVLLDHGAAVNVGDKNGQTPLFKARSPEVMRLLLAHGADVNARDRNGWRPLMYVVYSPDLVRLLLEYGADANGKDNTGATPLMGAGIAPAALALLLDYGADIDAKDRDGKTPLMCALQFHAVPEVVRLMLAHHANVNAQNNTGVTALYFAVTNSADGDIIRQLLEHGADPNLAERGGDTPLKAAKNVNRLDLVAMFRHYGANNRMRTAGEVR